MLKSLFSRRKQELAAVQAQVDDGPGWAALAGGISPRPHEYDPGRVQELYADALDAWRKHPMAWRAVAITTDYVVGDRLVISSPDRGLNRFIQAFWSHPQNRMAQRLETMSDELARAGDLFVLLFRNPQDGMSYIRFVTKDRIRRIETAPNDWETELAYDEIPPEPAGEPRRWYAPAHPAASEGEAVMLHYSVNRPLGALLGESDLTTMIPWLLRYSRMLEDRVRLNWAMRAFLWMVTVPPGRVREKQEQYRRAPEPGSVIVKDDSERWEPNAPNLHGLDAGRDLQAVRGMIDAGSGYPPHWRGDAGDISLATAQAMQAPTERHLRRRQQYFLWMLQDILYHAYGRAVEIGRVPRLAGVPQLAGAPRLTGTRRQREARQPGGVSQQASQRQPANDDYAALFRVGALEISRWDNESLARSARDITQAFAALGQALQGTSDAYRRQALAAAFKFMGEPLSEEALQELVEDKTRGT